MTESQLQDALNSLYEGDTNTPDSTTEDYLSRRGLFNSAINMWEFYGNTQWDELFYSLSDAVDGDTTTVAGTSSYACPSNFLNIKGFLRLVDSAGGSTYYEQKSPSDVQLYDNTSNNPNFFYITGNPSVGYSVNIHPTPAVDGLTIKYEYVASATTLSSTTSVPEMSDPYFCIYYALSRMYQTDGLSGKANEVLGIAELKLINMKKRNGLLSYYQDNGIKDRDFSLGVMGFGN